MLWKERQEGQASREEGGRKQGTHLLSDPGGMRHPQPARPAQEGCPDHRNTPTHWHKACRPGKHKRMSQVHRLLCLVIWEADACRERHYTEPTVTLGKGTSAQALRRGLAGQADDRLHSPLREQGCSVGPGRTHIPLSAIPASESAPDSVQRAREMGFLPACWAKPWGPSCLHRPTQAGSQTGMATQRLSQSFTRS